MPSVTSNRVARWLVVGVCLTVVGLIGLYAYDHDGPKGLPVVGRLPWRLIVGNTAIQAEARAVDDRFEERRRAEPPSPWVVFLGDSLTKNWLEEGKAVWEREFAPLEAAALGVAGDRTQHLLYRIRSGAYDGLEPAVVVLMIGTNNLNRNTAEEIAEAISLVVREVQTRWSRSHIVVVAIPPRELPRSRTVLEKADEANRLVAFHYASDSRVTFVDDEDRFVTNDGWINHALYTEEGVHFSAAGYEVLARLIRPMLEQHVPESLVIGGNGTG